MSQAMETALESIRNDAQSESDSLVLTQEKALQREVPEEEKGQAVYIDVQFMTNVIERYFLSDFDILSSGWIRCKQPSGVYRYYPPDSILHITSYGVKIGG